MMVLMQLLNCSRCRGGVDAVGWKDIGCFGFGLCWWIYSLLWPNFVVCCSCRNFFFELLYNSHVRRLRACSMRLGRVLNVTIFSIVQKPVIVRKIGIWWVVPVRKELKDYDDTASVFFEYPLTAYRLKLSRYNVFLDSVTTRLSKKLRTILSIYWVSCLSKESFYVALFWFDWLFIEWVKTLFGVTATR